MRYARWNGGEYDQAAAQRLREAGYPALLAAVLAARGVSGPGETAPIRERAGRRAWAPAGSTGPGRSLRATRAGLC